MRKDLAGYGGFEFPEPVHCPRLEDFITQLGPQEFETLPSEEIGGGRARENVARAIQPLMQRGVNIFERPFLIETGTTVGRGSASPIGMANTITKTEAGRSGYWCPYKGGFLTSDELASLQGFPVGLIPWSELGISGRQYQQLVGNAMTLTVLLHLLPPALHAAGLLGRQQFFRCVRAARAFKVRK